MANDTYSVIVKNIGKRYKIDMAQARQDTLRGVGGWRAQNQQRFQTRKNSQSDG